MRYCEKEGKWRPKGSEKFQKRRDQSGRVKSMILSKRKTKDHYFEESIRCEKKNGARITEI